LNIEISVQSYHILFLNMHFVFNQEFTGPAKVKVFKQFVFEY